MSANQIPAPFPRLRDTSHAHDCPECWRNGGPGHRLDPVKVPIRRTELPAWAEKARTTTTKGQSG